MINIVLLLLAFLSSTIALGQREVDADTLKFNYDATNATTLQAATAASPITLTLPSTAGGNGQCMVSDGAGVFSWASPLTALTGDVSATGPGSVAATVNSVGGSTAANVHSAELAANAATATNTPSTIVKRDSSGNTGLSSVTLSGSSSGTTLLQPAATASGTLTLPALTDTMISRQSTDQGAGRLTNKDLSAASVQFVDSSDTTKEIKFSASGASTNSATTLAGVQSTNRTLTLPDATDTLVAKATTDTLTNKTLSGNTAASLINGSGTTNFPSSGTITIPAATDTLVGRATTDTLTNKTLKDTTTTIANAADTSKTYVWDLSGATASTKMTVASSQTANRTLTLPDTTDTLTANAATQTLTNKTLTAPVISSIVNSGTLTLPSSSDTLVGRATTDTLTNKTLTNHVWSGYGDLTEIATPSNPSSGVLRVYSKSGDNLFTLNSAGTETQVGSGSGQKNYVQSGTSTTTGWAASGAGITVTNDTTAADLPRPQTTKSAIKFLGVSGSTAFGYNAFQLDPSDYNTKLQVQFSQACGLSGAAAAIANCAANDFQVQVFSCTVAWSGGTCSGTSVRLALSTDSSAVSGLPALTGTYRTTFDAPGSSAAFIQLEIGLNATQTHAITLSDIVVGPGVVTQGAAVTQWQTYTPTLGITLNATGAVGPNGRWRRVGDSIEVEVSFINGSGGAATGSPLTISLPSGLTLNTASMSSSSSGVQTFGSVTFYNGTSYQAQPSLSYRSGNTSIGVLKTTGSDFMTGADVPANSNIGVHFVAPINEWAGAGTVNVVQNTPEFACSTTGTWDAAAATGNTIYGPAGCPITGALTAQRIKDLQWQYPQGAGDVVDLYIKYNGVWTLASGLFPFCAQGTVLGGEQAYPLSSTQYEVTFYQYSACTGASFGAAGQAWTSTSTAWVAVKHSGNQAVGFGAANTTSSGLVSYEDSGTFSVTWAGPATPTTTIGYARVGKIITLYFPRTTQTCSSAAAFTASAVVPSGLRPAHASFFPEYVEDNSVNQTTSGTLTVFANGNLEIDKTFATSAFTGSGACGFFEGSFTYSTY